MLELASEIRQPRSFSQASSSRAPVFSEMPRRTYSASHASYRRMPSSTVMGRAYSWMKSVIFRRIVRPLYFSA